MRLVQVQKARLSALTHLMQKAGLKKAAAAHRCAVVIVTTTITTKHCVAVSYSSSSP